MARPALADEVVIGALAYRGHADAVARWSATADYLSREIPEHRFVIRPMSLNALRNAVAEGQVHFALTNPGHYVVLESAFGATRIVTLQATFGGEIYTRFGAAVIARADRTDLNGLEDLKGRSFRAVAPNAFGGFQMAWRELAAAGLDLEHDLAELSFSGFPQDAIVYAVLLGKVDAGTVRSGIVERMIGEGKLKPGQIKVLNARVSEDFFPQHSTRLYPEWPFAKVKDTSEALAKQVAQALLRMPADSAAALASRGAGWTIPLDYTPVHELMRELRIGPYEGLGHVSLQDVLREHGAVVMLTLGLLLVLAGSTAWISHANRRLAQSQAELAAHRDNLEQQVALRTHELRRVNVALENDIQARRLAEQTLQRSRTALQKLYEISVDHGQDHTQKLNSLMHLGREHFGMEAALLYRHGADGLKLCAADGDTHFAEEAASCMRGLVGTKGPADFKPGRTRCGSRMLLGFPVMVHDDQRCLLAFVGDQAHRPELDAVDRELLRLMAQWIGAEMERQDADEERERHRAQMTKVARLNTMGEMASGLAHELNQPLTAALNYTSGSLRRLAENGHDVDEVVQGMERALEGVNRATAIIRHLREFVQTGVPAQEPFAVHLAINRVIDLLAPEARRSGVALHKFLPERQLTVRGDLMQVEQVVLNLIRNGIEATPTGGSVSVSAQQWAELVVVCVADEGPGIELDSEGLFDPFYTTKADGMGLGLSISRSIVEAHGGRLWAENNNNGAQFCFELPLVKEN